MIDGREGDRHTVVYISLQINALLCYTLVSVSSIGIGIGIGIDIARNH